MTRRAYAGIVAAVLLAAVGLASSRPAVATAVSQRCDGRVATIVGTAGKDHIVGTPGEDVIVGLKGWDNIDARGGDDVICGDKGADRLSGGRGDDSLDGGVDSLLYGEDHYGDTLMGGPGNDRIDGGPGLGPNTRGLDTVDYRSALGGLILNLAKRTATVGKTRDTVVSIETVYGTAYADRL
jgi:Ca2+-binding RTX toxin-like protein